MSLATFVRSAIAVGVVLLATGLALAQGPARYEPARPTVSPYLNLFRRDLGRVPNYYTLVRPQLQQQAINERTQATLQRQRTQLQGVRQQLLNVERSTMRPTGSGGGFMNYSHYYNAPAR
jgi:hypothetical protein